MDESGAKGFASNKETELGEFGVAAGYFVQESQLQQVRGDFKAILEEVAGGHNGKSHVVDFSPDQQSLARLLVFNYLQDQNMACCYEAIYVQGLHETTSRENSTPLPDVRRPENMRYPDLRPTNPRLISEVFNSLLVKALAYAIEKCGSEVTLKVIVDTTDSTILDEYRESVNQLLNLFEPQPVHCRGWDLSLQSSIVHFGEIRTTCSSPDMENLLRRVEFDIACEDSELTFAADVLVGSVRHHLMNKVKVSGPGMLNSKDAIAGHVLASNMFGASELPSEQSFLDARYRHPERPQN